MVVELKPEHREVIDSAIRSGAYQDPNDVFAQAFEILRAQFNSEAWLTDQRDEVADKIARGFAQAEPGELMDGDAAMEMLPQRRQDEAKPGK